MVVKTTLRSWLCVW